MDYRYLPLILFSVACGVIAQLLFKRGMTGKELSLTTLMNLNVVIGFALYGLASLTWLIVLSKVQLSSAYPMLSLGYVAVLLLSAWLFHEPLTTKKLIAVGLIVLGVTQL